jgi:OmpA-OmpF porin, OOP family
MKQVACRILTALLLVALAGAATPADAQVLKKLKAKVKERVEQRSDELLNKVVDTADKAVMCLVTDQECAAKAKKEGRPVTYTDDEGNVVAPPPVVESPPVESPPAVAPPQQAPTEQGAAPRPGEGAWANYDFIPGEKVLFADDFSSEQVGNFPRRLEYLFGSMQLVEAQGKSWLQVVERGAFDIPLPEVLGDRFTLEALITLPWHGLFVYPGQGPDYRPDPTGETEEEMEYGYFVVTAPEAGIKGPGGAAVAVVDPRRIYGMNDELEGHVVWLRIHVDGDYAKLYLDEHRIANVPRISLMRTNKITFEVTTGSEPWLMTALSVNAGGRKIYDALMADGRIVTRGILFDTGSDRLRAESTPTLSEIGTMLRDHPDLRIAIEGHTDDVGDDAANLSLSQRRAESVRSYLAQQHGIDGGRLEARGIGETKPIALNNTAEGRQSNRRVELVKL